MIDFLRFSPSVIAAAAVLTAAGENVETLPDSTTFDERVDKVMFYRIVVENSNI